MLFDLALAFHHRARIKEAVRAIGAEEWTTLAALVREGLSPNQRLPVSDLPGISRQGPRSTTPFLAMSLHPIKASPDALRDAFELALEKGAKISFRAVGDKRTALDHQANIRSLEGWKLICAHRAVPAADLIKIARSLNWGKGEAFAEQYRAEQENQALDQATAQAQARPRPRL